MAPLVVLVPDDLKRYKEPLEQFLLKFIPYQHLYYTLILPILRVSWCSQSIIYVFGAPISKYRKDRADALAEQVGIIIHWSWVLLQLYLLPSNWTRVLYFMISQLGAGFLVAHVVTYNHNSVDKYPGNLIYFNKNNTYIHRELPSFEQFCRFAYPYYAEHEAVGIY